MNRSFLIVILPAIAVGLGYILMFHWLWVCAGAISFCGGGGCDCRGGDPGPAAPAPKGFAREPLAGFVGCVTSTSRTANSQNNLASGPMRRIDFGVQDRI